MVLASVHTLVGTRYCDAIDMIRSRVVLAWLAGLGLFGAACGAREADSVATTTSAITGNTPTAESTTTTTAHTLLSDFIAAADAACVATFPRMMALSDPDGDGGQKQLGLGTVVREWAEELASITAPDEIADEWAAAVELLRQSGVKLEESEQLYAAGDPGYEAAQSEALWDLQPRASEIILALEIPFLACSFS